MKNKAICIIMVLMLTITPCYRAYADAGSITIAGGTIGVGGVAGSALAGLAGPAVVAVFCGMMAVGIDVELTKQSQQAGMTKTQYVKSKIEQYCSEAGKTADVFYKGITNGTSVLADGTLAFSDAVSTQIKQFINWLFDSNQVSEPITNTGAGTVVLGNHTYPVVTRCSVIFSSTYIRNFEFNGPVALIRYGGGDSYLIVTNASGITDTQFREDGSYYTTENIDYYYNGYYYRQLTTRGFVGFGEWNSYDPTYTNANIDFSGRITDLINSWDGSFDVNMGTEATHDGFTGTRDDWNNRSNVFDPAQGYPTVVNPGVVGQIPIPADTDITVNVREYLEKLQEVLDQLKDRVIEGVDKADGIPKDWDIPDTVEANPTIGKHPPIPDSDKTPVTNDDPPSPATEPNIASGPLKFNLTEIFPFCIPFDIKDMIGLLEAEPVAPAYTVNWNIPIVNVPLNFTVDLSPWNSVATICRKMEMLLFIIGLAMVTRNLIRG